MAPMARQLPLLRVRLDGLRFVGSPTSTTTTNPSLAATWPVRERVSAEFVAAAWQGTVEEFVYTSWL